MVRRRNAPHRAAERPPVRDARQSDRLRRLAGGVRCADHPVLRPLRRAAGRSPEPVGVAAVRGDRPRRRDLRARRRRRQGPGVHALQGGRGVHEAERPPAGEHQDHSRRRRGGWERKPRRFHPRSQGRAPVRRRRDIRFRDVRARCAVDLLWPARSGVFPDRPARQQHGSPFRIVRRCRRQPRLRSVPDDRADEGSQRPDQDSGLLRRCEAAFGRGTAGVGVAAVQREEVQEGFRHPEAARRDGLHHPRTNVGEADLRGQRTAVGVHRRRCQDRPAGRRDGEGQHAARAESGSQQDCRLVPEVRRGYRAEDRRAEDHPHARRQAVDDLVRQSLRAGRRPRDREGFRPGADLHARGGIDPGRLDVPGGTGPAVSAVRGRPS